MRLRFSEKLENLMAVSIPATALRIMTQIVKGQIIWIV